MYQMTSNGTRLRMDHTTYSDPPILTVNSGTVVKGDILWTAPADGNEVWAGDQWLHVTHISDLAITVQGWMAYRHKGIYYATNFVELSAPPPPPTETFPEYFILEAPTGERQRYDRTP